MKKLYFLFTAFLVLLMTTGSADMTVLGEWDVFTTQDPDHVNFAYLAKTNEGKLLLGFSTGVHPANETWNSLMSDDNGVTWVPMVPAIGTVSYLDLPYDVPAISLGTTAWKLPSPAVNTMQTWMLYGYYNLEQVRRKRANIVFPYDPESLTFHRSIVRLDNGRLLATGYAKRVGSSLLECVVVKSDDYGKSWEYLATAVQKEAWMLGVEGPSEPVMVQLKNGNLLLVARNGDIGPPDWQPASEVPMVYTLSTDQGATWSAPVSLGTPGVGQDMLVLEDGRVVLSYGRPNVYIRVADSTGTNWGTPITIYEGPGSGYTGMQLGSDGNILLVYNKSDFGGIGQFGLLEGTTNYMKMVKISVQRPCGNMGYGDADFDENCAVNLSDFAVMASQWLN